MNEYLHAAPEDFEPHREKSREKENHYRDTDAARQEVYSLYDIFIKRNHLYNYTPRLFELL